MNHIRKCHDCGNVAEHEDNITPWVLCKKCGSQDTRIPRHPQAATNEATLFKSGGLEVRRDDQNNYRTIGSERQIVRELAERFHEQEDALERIAREFENLGLKCDCKELAACSVCEIRMLLESYL